MHTAVNLVETRIEWQSMLLYLFLRLFFIIDRFPNINFHNGSEYMYYKNNKNSALIPQYTHTFFSGSARGHILKLIFVNYWICFCSFTIIENVMYHFY